MSCSECQSEIFLAKSKEFRWLRSPTWTYKKFKVAFQWQVKNINGFLWCNYSNWTKWPTWNVWFSCPCIIFREWNATTHDRTFFVPCLTKWGLGTIEFANWPSLVHLFTLSARQVPSGLPARGLSWHGMSAVLVCTNPWQTSRLYSLRWSYGCVSQSGMPFHQNSNSVLTPIWLR